MSYNINYNHTERQITNEDKIVLFAKGFLPQQISFIEFLEIIDAIMYDVLEFSDVSETIFFTELGMYIIQTKYKSKQPIK